MVIANTVQPARLAEVNFKACASLISAAQLGVQPRAALSYSARGYDSAVCCSKMSRDAFLGDALYEADKVLEKFAAASRECACLQDGRQSRR